MAIGEILLAVAMLVFAVACLALTAWIMYRIGLYIALNMYGHRLGIEKPTDDD